MVWCAEQTFPAGTLIWDRRYGCPLSAQPLNHVEAPKEENRPNFNCSHKPHRSLDIKSPSFKHILLFWTERSGSPTFKFFPNYPNLRSILWESNFPKYISCETILRLIPRHCMFMPNLIQIASTLTFWWRQMF